MCVWTARINFVNVIMVAHSLMKKRLYLVLCAIFLLGLVFRLIYFKEANFGWDQARDAFQAMDIWQGDSIKLIGPGTAELPGLHHGSFYWYLISPFYFFSNGNIYAVRLFLIMLNLIGVFAIFHTASLLFKNKSIALLSSLLFAMSFEAVQYARWLSNPSPALLTISLTFLGLWYVLNNKKWGIPLALISWAFSIHFQFFLVYQIVIIAPVLIWYYRSNKHLFNKEDFLGFFGWFFVLIPFLIAEIKFKFQGLKAFAHLFERQEQTRALGEISLAFVNRVIATFQFNILGLNHFLAGLFALTIFVSTIIYIRKNKFKKELVFLLVWLLSPVIIAPFDKAHAYFVTVGNLSPAIILASFFFVEYGKKHRSHVLYYIFLIGVLFLGQLNLILDQNKNGESLFSVQQKMIVSDQLRVMDYVYQRSGKKPFVINTVTNPLFINTTWAYLFSWYGVSKYGYMPSWAGYPQDGQFGSSTKFTPITDRMDKDFYVIVEPQPGIPEHMIRGVLMFEDTRSVILETKKIGEFTVQKRRFINNDTFDTDAMYGLMKRNSTLKSL